MNSLIAFFWVAAHCTTLQWVWHKALYRNDVQLLGFLLVMGLVFTAYKIRLNFRLYPARPAFVLLFVSAVCTFINALTIRLPQLDVTFMVMGVYGCLGLYESLWPKWPKLLSLVLLVSLALPFYLEFSSGLGFGLRLVTAELVEHALLVFHVAAISSQDIIVTENAIAHVDIPCSGLKSLWIGTAFFLAALVLQRVRITWRTLWAYVVLMALLFSANVFRVLILTLLTGVYDLPHVAEIVHVPQGIFGFSISCMLVWLMLSHQKEHEKKVILSPQLMAKPRPLCLGFMAVISVYGVMSYADILHSEPTLIAANIPKSLQAEPLPLSEGEKRYFARSTDTLAQKWRFHWKGGTGSILVVQSLDFNMFHAPELCMAANGVHVDKTQTVFHDHQRYRVMSLNQGTTTGLYWLQSNRETTDNFIQRYLDYIVSHKKNWRMVSIVLNKKYDGENLSLEELMNTIYKSGLDTVI